MGGRSFNTPVTSPEKNCTTLRHLLDLDCEIDNETAINISPRSDQNHELLSIITYRPSSISSPQSPSNHNLKRLKLSQLLSVLKSLKQPLHNDILSPIISTLGQNFFRTLPPAHHSAAFHAELPDDMDQDIVFFPSPAWDYLNIAYNILLWLVTNISPDTLKDFIDHSFLLNLLCLFQSDDHRERDSLKNVYHQIYYRFHFYRSFMRKSMKSVFLDYLYEADQRHCGIKEMLEIWGSIISGFTVPLKEEHSVFLIRILIPLHKAKGLTAYHRQLAYCVSQFVQKEPLLGGVVVRRILRYWPVTNSQKEVLLIGELEELVDIMDPELRRNLALPLCTKITRCLNSLNSQVAERALYMWNNEEFVKMALVAIEEVYPVVVEGLEENLNGHWSNSVRHLTEIIKIMLEEMDPVLYSNTLQHIQLRQKAALRE